MSLDPVGIAFSSLYALIEHDFDALQIIEASVKYPAHLLAKEPRHFSKEEQKRRLISIAQIIKHSIESIKCSYESVPALSSLKTRITPALEKLGLASLLEGVDSPSAASGGGSSSTPTTVASDPISIDSETAGLIGHYPLLEPFLEGTDLYSLSQTCIAMKSQIQTQKADSGIEVLRGCLQMLVDHFTTIVKATCESSCLNILRRIPFPVMESILKTFFQFPENRFNREIKEAIACRLTPELLIEYYERHKSTFLPLQKQDLIKALFSEPDLTPGELLSLCKGHDFLIKSPKASSYLENKVKSHIEFKYIGPTFQVGAPSLKAHWQITFDTAALFGTNNTLWAKPTAFETSAEGLPIIPDLLTAKLIAAVKAFMDNPSLEKCPIVVLLKPSLANPFPGYSPPYLGFTFPLAEALHRTFTPLFIEHRGTLPASIFSPGEEVDKVIFLN